MNYLKNNMHAANCSILDCITKFVLSNLLAHYNPVQKYPA